MNHFGESSKFKLSTCDVRLQNMAHQVLKIKDHSIIKGHRNKAEQNHAYNEIPRRSKLKWPDGKHNSLPSLAMDVRTYPSEYLTDQELREEQLYLLGLYRGIAAQLDILLRTGADWDRDGVIADNGFDDFFHVEIVEQCEHGRKLTDYCEPCGRINSG